MAFEAKNGPPYNPASEKKSAGNENNAASSPSHEPTLPNDTETPGQEDSELGVTPVKKKKELTSFGKFVKQLIEDAPQETDKTTLAVELFVRRFHALKEGGVKKIDEDPATRDAIDDALIDSIMEENKPEKDKKDDNSPKTSSQKS